MVARLFGGILGFESTINRIWKTTWWLERSLSTRVIVITCVPSTSFLNSMLLTKALSLSGPRASQTAITAPRNYCCVAGRLSISRIWIAILSQICLMWFIPGLLAGQSMTLTSWFSRKVIVDRALCEGTLSWTSTKLLRKVPLAQGKRFCLSTRRSTYCFMGTSTMTSSLLPPSDRRPTPCWMAPHGHLLHTSINIYLPFTPANSKPTIIVI